MTDHATNAANFCDGAQPEHRRGLNGSAHKVERQAQGTTRDIATIRYGALGTRKQLGSTGAGPKSWRDAKRARRTRRFARRVPHKCERGGRLTRSTFEKLPRGATATAARPDTDATF
jgi:hypothetical protein